MVIPNLIAVFLLSGVVVKLVKEYFAGEGAASTLKNSREIAGKRQKDNDKSFPLCYN